MSVKIPIQLNMIVTSTSCDFSRSIAVLATCIIYKIFGTVF